MFVFTQKELPGGQVRVHAFETLEAATLMHTSAVEAAYTVSGIVEINNYIKTAHDVVDWLRRNATTLMEMR